MYGICGWCVLYDVWCVMYATWCSVYYMCMVYDDCGDVWCILVMYAR